MAHSYSGWKKDLKDDRDHLYMVSAPIAIPNSVDLSPNCSPVEDQGSLGSCTGNSIVGSMEYIQRAFKKNKTDYSRLFVYYNERLIEGTVDEDSGAYIRDGIKTLVTYGVCPEKNCAYNISKFTKKPTKTAYKNALRHKITSYQRLNGLEQMKECLAAGYPFVFGFAVFESFESQEVANTGIVPMPADNDQIIGGHAVCAVGYDDVTHLIKVRNSWGELWGDKGYFYMPYAYIADNNLADDFWTIRS